jgi:hypothetical protein
MLTLVLATVQNDARALWKRSSILSDLHIFQDSVGMWALVGRVVPGQIASRGNNVLRSHEASDMLTLVLATVQNDARALWKRSSILTQLISTVLSDLHIFQDSVGMWAIVGRVVPGQIASRGNNGERHANTGLGYCAK